MEERKVDQEYRAPDGNCTIQISRQEDMIFMKHVGKFRLEDADFLLNAVREWKVRIGRPFPVILDITDYEGEEPEVRNKMTKTILGHDSPFACFALVGGNFLVRTMFNLHGRVAKIPLKMFATEAEAVAWVKER